MSEQKDQLDGFIGEMDRRAQERAKRHEAARAAGAVQRIKLEIDVGPSWLDYDQRLREYEFDVTFLGGSQINVKLVGADWEPVTLHADTRKTPDSDRHEWGDYIATNDRQLYHAIRNWIAGVDWAVSSVRVDRNIGAFIGGDLKW